MTNSVVDRVTGTDSKRTFFKRFLAGDPTIDPNLVNRISIYKWCEGRNLGRDIGIVAAVVGFFVDNVSILPDLGDRGELFELRGCNNTRNMRKPRKVLFDIAVTRKQYSMGAEEEREVSYEEASEEFIQEDLSGFTYAARVSFCVNMCKNAPYCPVAHADYERLKRREQGFNIII